MLLYSKEDCQCGFEFDLLDELEGVHLVFHISMFMKRMGDPSLIILTMNILIKDNLSYKEIMVYIQDRQVRNLLKKIFGKLKIT